MVSKAEIGWLLILIGMLAQIPPPLGLEESGSEAVRMAVAGIALAGLLLFTLGAAIIIRYR